MMVDLKQVQKWVLAMPDTVLDYPYDEGVAVYKVGSVEGTMFALIDEKSMPVRLSLRCDPKLSLLLREKYETVLPGYRLSKKYWNTVICSGQLDESEIRDLIRHSYELAITAS